LFVLVSIAAIGLQVRCIECIWIFILNTNGLELLLDSGTESLSENIQIGERENG
jgi:hypothetical protein